MPAGFLAVLPSIIGGVAGTAGTVYASRSQSSAARRAQTIQQQEAARQRAQEQELLAEERRQFDEVQEERRRAFEAEQAELTRRTAEEERRFELTRSDRERERAEDLGLRNREFEEDRSRYQARETRLQPYRQAGASAVATLSQLAAQSGPPPPMPGGAPPMPMPSGPICAAPTGYPPPMPSGVSSQQTPQEAPMRTSAALRPEDIINMSPAQLNALMSLGYQPPSLRSSFHA